MTVLASIASHAFRNRRLAAVAGAAMVALALHVQAVLAADAAYRLAAGDTLSFDFVDDMLPAEQLAISSDGSVSVPLLGNFPVTGRTVSEALDAMRAAFVERNLLVDPKISLTVASFRPIYVLGDVKAPGSFAFQPLLTVEQAVALAGGQATGGATAEDRVVTRARLRGDLEESEVQIAREGVAAARLTAQLDGHPDVSDDDLPPKARPIVRPSLVATLLANERRILDTEGRGFVTRRDQLTAAVAEVQGALANLDQLAEKQKSVIASAQAEADRIKGLRENGLKTLTEVAGVEREVTTQESHLLEVYNQMSTTRRELGDLQRQLVDLTDNRMRLALGELQTHTAEIERLLAARTSIEEQILLLSNLAIEAERRSGSLRFNYQVRRANNGQVETTSVSLGTPVMPGDTVLVSIIEDGSASGDSSIPLASAELLRTVP